MGITPYHIMNNHKNRKQAIKSCSLSLCKCTKITSGFCMFFEAISKWLRGILYVFFKIFAKIFLWLHKVLAIQKICIIRKESIPCGLYCTIPIALFLSIKKVPHACDTFNQVFCFACFSFKALASFCLCLRL